MKRIKLLSLIVVFIAVMFASCEETYEGGGNGGNSGSGGLLSNDCYCVASGMISVGLYSEGEPTIVNFEGDCADATWEDLPAEWQELYPAEDVDALGLTLTCQENY